MIRFRGRHAWTIDIEEMDRLLDRSAQLDNAGDLHGAVALAREALGWYRGPWLADGRLSAGDEIERDRLRS